MEVGKKKKMSDDEGDEFFKCWQDSKTCEFSAPTFSVEKQSSSDLAKKKNKKTWQTFDFVLPQTFFPKTQQQQSFQLRQNYQNKKTDLKKHHFWNSNRRHTKVVAQTFKIFLFPQELLKTCLNLDSRRLFWWQNKVCQLFSKPCFWLCAFLSVDRTVRLASFQHQLFQSRNSLPVTS